MKNNMIKENQEQELGFLIFNFMSVMLGALVTGTGTANGLWELIAGGYIMMIYGNLSLWKMVREQLKMKLPPEIK